MRERDREGDRERGREREERVGERGRGGRLARHQKMTTCDERRKSSLVVSPRRARAKSRINTKNNLYELQHVSDLIMVQLTWIN